MKIEWPTVEEIADLLKSSYREILAVGNLEDYLMEKLSCSVKAAKAISRVSRELGLLPSVRPADSEIPLLAKSILVGSVLHLNPLCTFGSRFAQLAKIKFFLHECELAGIHRLTDLPRIIECPWFFELVYIVWARDVFRVRSSVSIGDAYNYIRVKEFLRKFDVELSQFNLLRCYSVRWMIAYGIFESHGLVDGERVVDWWVEKTEGLSLLEFVRSTRVSAVFMASTGVWGEVDGGS